MKKNILVVKTNLLPWYDELSDCLELHRDDFPKGALRKIAKFGTCTLQHIDNKKSVFVRDNERTDAL